MDFRRQGFARGQVAKRGQYLLLVTEREQLGGREPNFDIRMPGNRLYQRLHFTGLGHQEENREGVVSAVTTFADQTVNGIRCQSRSRNRRPDPATALRRSLA